MSPIPPQATRFNILKAPATGAQGTHILSESAVPLRKNTPHTQIPGSRCGDSPATHTHPGPSFLLRASRLHSHSSPPSPQPGAPAQAGSGLGPGLRDLSQRSGRFPQLISRIENLSRLGSFSMLCGDAASITLGESSQTPHSPQ